MLYHCVLISFLGCHLFLFNMFITLPIVIFLLLTCGTSVLVIPTTRYILQYPMMGNMIVQTYSLLALLIFSISLLFDVFDVYDILFLYSN